MDRNWRSIPDRVRAQLLALGIPAPSHTVETLVDYFPRDFNITAAGLNGEDLANVLLHFARHGVISVSHKSTITNVQPGWHLCQFYRDSAQLLEMTAPYITDGLKNGEASCWILPEAVTRAAACTALAARIEDLESYFASGQLELLAYRQWYLTPTGALKTFEQLGAALLERQDAALAKGYKLLRVAGDAGWVSKSEQCTSFIEYEVRINEALKSTKVAALCTYCADVTADELIAIITAHQDALYAPTAA